MRQEIQYLIVSIPLYKYNIGVQENFITLNSIDIFHQQINTSIMKNIILVIQFQTFPILMDFPDGIFYSNIKIQ